jgi:cytosine/adenosine deaminase-related metal-dependent hydrolase
VSRYGTVLAAFLATLTLAAPAVAIEPVPLDHGVTVFTGVSVIPMDRDTVLANRTVLVRDGKIAAIGSAAKVVVPKAARRIDGRGKFLIPGLCDMHVHLRYLSQAGDNPVMLTLFLANGVTTVLNLLGLPEHLELRDSIATGAVLAPVVYTSGIYMNPPYVNTPAQVDSAVIAQKEAGVDFIKIHGDLRADAYHQLMVSAHREGLRVIGHAPRNLGFEVLVREHQDAIAHAEEFLYAYFLFQRPPPTSLAEIDSMIHYAAVKTAGAGIWLMPTLTCYRNIAGQIENLDSVLALPDMRYVPAGIAADWQRGSNLYLKPPFTKGNVARVRDSYFVLERLVKAFEAAGVKMVAGTDTPVSATPPGFALHDELANLVAAGLTPYQALRLATANAAEFAGASDRFGTVAVGRRADLVLLAANPLTDIHATRRIAGVMVRGHWLPADRIAATLGRVAAGR